MPRLPSAKSPYEYKRVVTTVRGNNNIVTINSNKTSNKSTPKHQN